MLGLHEPTCDYQNINIIKQDRLDSRYLEDRNSRHYDSAPVQPLHIEGSQTVVTRSQRPVE